MKKEITIEEYEKAYEIVRRFEYQRMPKTKQVSIDYNAIVSVTVRVPDEMSIDEIKSELEDGYYDYEEEDAVRTKLVNMVDLIVDGIEIKL